MRGTGPCPGQAPLRHSIIPPSHNLTACGGRGSAHETHVRNEISPKIRKYEDDAGGRALSDPCSVRRPYYLRTFPSWVPSLLVCRRCIHPTTRRWKVDLPNGRKVQPTTTRCPSPNISQVWWNAMGHDYLETTRAIPSLSRRAPGHGLAISHLPEPLCLVFCVVF